MKNFEFNAGFRPGSRTTLVSAKGPKTIDAQFGRIRLIGREAGRRANSLRSNKPVENKSVRSGGRTAGVGQGKGAKIKKKRSTTYLTMCWVFRYSPYCIARPDPNTFFNFILRQMGSHILYWSSVKPFGKEIGEGTGLQTH